MEGMGAKGVQELLLFPIAEKQGLFLQRSRPGLISTVLPTDFIYLFIFALVGGGTALPTAMRRGTAVSSSSWPFGA